MLRGNTLIHSSLLGLPGQGAPRWAWPWTGGGRARTQRRSCAAAWMSQGHEGEGRPPTEKGNHEGCGQSVGSLPGSLSSEVSPSRGCSVPTPNALLGPQLPAQAGGGFCQLAPGVCGITPTLLGPPLRAGPPGAPGAEPPAQPHRPRLLVPPPGRSHKAVMMSQTGLGLWARVLGRSGWKPESPGQAVSAGPSALMRPNRRPRPGGGAPWE